ncbi:sulfhydryl oxidase 2 [Agrilus planipennis]|uniref:Sulfhydryl oxidase n=1 Tax=Agrilus planipennis TaxID=224129 RepID=A0A1W4XTZ0_AGRPL|nr:sulfhydryl oxidase 2 [Agrilus planipennis]
MYGKEQLCSAFIVLLCFRVTQNASLSLSEQNKYKSLIEGQGLYTLDDGVEILTSHNFKNELYGQKNAWLIEFYNSWCGFCQRFAPSWKALANDVREWKDLVNIGAIDCSDDDNSKICRDFEIMAYPTLLYFHENFQEGPDNRGAEVVKGTDVHTHREKLIEKLIREQTEGRGKIFPPLLPIHDTSNVDKIFSELPVDIRYVFLIVESPQSLLGPTVAMDLHKINEIRILHTFNNNSQLLGKLGITTSTSVIALSLPKDMVHLSGDFQTRAGISTAILNFLESKKIKIPERSPKPPIFTGKWADVEVPDISSLMEAREREALNKKIKEMGDAVFQMDLETALRISLKTEVGRMKNISGEKLAALKAYLNVLAKYFPFGQNGRVFLNQLRNRVNEATNTINGEQIFEIVKDAEKDNSKVFSSPERWLACKGSKPQYRGYPCGLWKLFHFLTVSSAESDLNDDHADPLEVLNAMHGYIKNFFGCFDCSNHFQDMARKKGLSSVQSRESAVLWLWMAHNTVNKRLSGDSTEDPENPKVQFPLTERCSLCKNTDGSWNYPEVLKYLKHVYSSINVRYIGSDSRILHLGLEGALPSNGSSSIFQNIDTKGLQEKDVRS